MRTFKIRPSVGDKTITIERDGVEDQFTTNDFVWNASANGWEAEHESGVLHFTTTELSRLFRSSK